MTNVKILMNQIKSFFSFSENVSVTVWNVNRNTWCANRMRCRIWPRVTLNRDGVKFRPSPFSPPADLFRSIYIMLCRVAKLDVSITHWSYQTANIMVCTTKSSYGAQLRSCIEHVCIVKKLGFLESFSQTRSSMHSSCSRKKIMLNKSIIFAYQNSDKLNFFTLSIILWGLMLLLADISSYLPTLCWYPCILSTTWIISIGQWLSLSVADASVQFVTDLTKFDNDHQDRKVDGRVRWAVNRKSSMIRLRFTCAWP